MGAAERDIEILNQSDRAETGGVFSMAGTSPQGMTTLPRRLPPQPDDPLEAGSDATVQIESLDALRFDNAYNGMLALNSPKEIIIVIIIPPP